MKSIPVTAARQIAMDYEADVVVITAWDKTGRQHVTTYGGTRQECRWAADLGNQIKSKILKWPAEECHTVPQKLEDLERSAL